LGEVGVALPAARPDRRRSVPECLWAMRVSRRPQQPQFRHAESPGVGAIGDGIVAD